MDKILGAGDNHDRAFAFGGGADDDLDALNDETFGNGLESDPFYSKQFEKEFEYFADQTASCSNSFNYGDTSSTYENYEEMVEQDISRLVDAEDDDDSYGVSIPHKRTNSASVDPYGEGTPQSPFLNADRMFSTNNGIWGSPSQDGMPPPPQQQQQHRLNNQFDSTDPKLQQLLMRLQETTVNEQAIRRGVKTLDEIEAEMRTPTSAVLKMNLETVAQQQHHEHQPPPVFPIQQPPEVPFHPHTPPPPFNRMNMPPGLAMLPPQFNDPRFRSMAAAMHQRFAATGIPYGRPPPPLPYGGPPPTMPHPYYQRFRPPPPPHLPPVPGENSGMPASNAQREGQHLTPNQHHHQQSTREMQQHHQQQQHGYDENTNAQKRPWDPYAYLMGRREKEWLLKIQLNQLQTNQPFEDDYYFAMYSTKREQEQRKRNAKSASDLPHRKDVGDNNSVYIPPSFEGSLGKVQVVSSAGPRQMIDLSKKESFDSDCDPSSSISQSQNTIQSYRRFKGLLFCIEQMYVDLLRCEQLLRCQEKDERQELLKLLEKLRQNTLGRFMQIVSVRKGKRLLSRILLILPQDKHVAILEHIAKELPILVKRDLNSELYDVLGVSVHDSLVSICNPKEVESLVKATLSADCHDLANIVSNRFGLLFWMSLLELCAIRSFVFDSNWQTLVNSVIECISSNHTSNGLVSQSMIGNVSNKRINAIIEYLIRLSIPQQLTSKFREFCIMHMH